MSPDKNVEAVREKLLLRSQIGLRKYGVTTERKDVDLRGWLNHLQQELLDAAVYAEAEMALLQANRLQAQPPAPSTPSPGPAQPAGESTSIPPG